MRPRVLAAIALTAMLRPALSAPAPPEDLTIGLMGQPSIIFDSQVDGCSSIDLPDINARAFRNASNQMVMFALHYVNRPLEGRDLAHLRIVCRVALESHEDSDPAHYDDHSYIAATWTRDGTHVSALVHHEYHADAHDRCTVTDSLGCWYNTVLGLNSADGGANFVRATPPAVVAAAPFPQEAEQGRHRGFFNPSNMFSEGVFVYAFISTTGWGAQDSGACLFRTRDPADLASWRAWDGKSFSIAYEDPYTKDVALPPSCVPIAPFRFPVGAVVRHRASGRFIAVFQSTAGGDTPVDGFYTSTSRDLFDWTRPRLLMAGPTLYNDLCKVGRTIMSYPSLIDARDASRNFDATGDHPSLVWAQMDVAHCTTGRRLLMRQDLTIEAARP